MLMAGDSSTLSYLRFLRLFRLLRLLRLLKLGEYIAAVEIRFDINLTVLRILQMVCYLLFLAHILGCFWFYMAALGTPRRRRRRFRHATHPCAA